MSPNDIEQERDGVITCYAENQGAWRSWLETQHGTHECVWLIIFHKECHVPSVTYEEAVEEALCFGWVDSKPNKRDDQSFYQYFAARNPKSNWSRKNKNTVERLISAGRMSQAGLAMVQLAKETGTWDALNDVENLVVPEDMEAMWRDVPEARKNFDAFPRSVKRGILEWIFNAKRPDTRKKRIRETVELAAQNIRANQYRK